MNQEQENALLLKELASLKEVESSFYFLLENTSDFIYFKDLNHRFTFASNAFAALTNHSSWRDIVGKNDFEIFPKEHAESYFELEKSVIIEGNELLSVEEPYYDKEGNLCWVSTSKRPIYNEKNEIVGLFGISRDITNRKLYEKELSKAKEKAEHASQSKSTFLANMSHEIRTPMNAILGFVDLLKKEDTGKKSLEYIEIIDNSSKSLLKIIEDILDFSKIESGKLDIEKIDFNTKAELETITHLFSAKCADKNISLSLNLDKNLPLYINTDPLRVKQVIANLLSNAIKFTDAGKRIEVNINYANNFLNVSVKDEGKGIAAEKLDHIFQSFSQEDTSTTREYGGTGLGLTISRAFVELLGGELNVKSELGVGSEFYFCIPATRAKELDEEEEILEELNFEGKKVLLVEDNKANQMFMSLVLDTLNLEVDIANDGLEALEKFRENKYDMILMDENMPNMNGIQATKEILEIEKENNLSHTPIIALTANALKGDRERFLAAGMDEYISKPVNSKKLSKLLSEFLVQ